MLTPDVRLEGFDTSDWVRLAEIFRMPVGAQEADDPSRQGDAPPAAARAPEQRPSGGVIAVTTGARLRKLVSTEAGRLDLREQPWPEPLSDLAERHNARWAAELKTGALEELMERFAEQLAPEHDALAQVLALVGILRDLEEQQRLEVWPWRLSSWPIPREAVVHGVFDAICPDGKAVALGAFAEGQLFTALVMRRRGNGFDLLLGPEPLRVAMGLVSGDFRRDYRYLVRAAEDLAGAELGLGCFAEASTFQRLVDRPAPGAWAAAVAARDVVVSPVTPAIAVPLGLDVGRAAFVAVRDLAERFGASDWLSQSVFAPTWDRVREFAPPELDIQRLLGFNPLLLLSKLVSREPGSGRGDD